MQTVAKLSPPFEFRYIKNLPSDRWQHVIEIWDDVLNPGGVYVSPEKFVYVAEQGTPTGHQPVGVSVFTETGELVTRFRGSESGLSQPHGIWADSRGNIFVAELAGVEGGGNRVLRYVRQ